MSTSKRTTLLTNVPIETWPGIDMSVLSGEDAESVEKRISALTLYAQGAPHKKITEETGIIRQEINRLLRRCTPLSDDGRWKDLERFFRKSESLPMYEPHRWNAKKAVAAQVARAHSASFSTVFPRLSTSSIKSFCAPPPPVKNKTSELGSVIYIRNSSNGSKAMAFRARATGSRTGPRPHPSRPRARDLLSAGNSLVRTWEQSYEN